MIPFEQSSNAFADADLNATRNENIVELDYRLLLGLHVQCSAPLHELDKGSDVFEVSTRSSHKETYPYVFADEAICLEAYYGNYLNLQCSERTLQVSLKLIIPENQFGKRNNDRNCRRAHRL